MPVISREKQRKRSSKSIWESVLQDFLSACEIVFEWVVGKIKLFRINITQSNTKFSFHTLMTNEESCYKAFLMAPDMSWESMLYETFQ